MGLVATMGALHDGHGELMGRAVRENDAVIASIFVNPTQFAAGEDLERYPRTFAEDLAMLERRGVVACFAPKTGCTLWKSLVKYVNTGVCRLQARDFTNFGYPCWDGIKDTFRIL